MFIILIINNAEKFKQSETYWPVLVVCTNNNMETFSWASKSVYLFISVKHFLSAFIIILLSGKLILCVRATKTFAGPCFQLIPHCTLFSLLYFVLCILSFFRVSFLITTARANSLIVTFVATFKLLPPAVRPLWQKVCQMNKRRGK